MTLLRIGCALGLAFASLGAGAQATLEQIATERQAVIARGAAQEAECQTHFSVSGCVQAVRKEQRVALARLRRQELQLLDAQRLEAARRRREVIEHNAQALQAREHSASDAPAAPKTARQPRPVAPQRAPAGSEPAQARRDAELSHEQAYEKRQREAEAHRLAVEQRNTAREAQGKVAPPLPQPPQALPPPSSPSAPR